MGTERKRAHDEVLKDDKGVYDMFNRSKKTIRSPEQREAEKQRKRAETKVSIGEATEEDMDELKQMMQEMMREMAKNTAELKEEIKDIKKEMNKKEEKWEEEKGQLMKRIENLENRAEREEKEKRMKNIVIKGIEITKGKEQEEVEIFLKDRLKVNTKISQAYQITKDDKTIMVVAKVESLEKKHEIMSTKNVLKDTKIFIDNDLTVEERKIQKEIRSIAKDERDNGKKVKVGFMKMYIDGEEYRWDKENQGVTRWGRSSDLPKKV